jgi:membrane-bound lytic murein transglycosylase B
MRRLLPTAFSLALVLLGAALPALPASAQKVVRGETPYATREDAMQFADDVATRRNLDRAWVRATIGNARLLPNVPRLMLPAPRGTAKNWRVYRSRFIDPVRIGAGVRFWRANAATLTRAEAEYGVPAEIIVGIVGVETIYGHTMGNFRVIDALATLSFDFPQGHPRAAERQAFFRGELESFLSTESRTAENPIDYDGDGRIDLVDNPTDVIGSVASYFKAFGWQPGMQPIYPVGFDEARLKKEVLLAPDILPSFSADSFVAGGAVLEGEALRHQGLLALIELQNGADAPSYVAGTQNFYVITRYNWSSYYAMSVIELGREVRAAMEN